MKLILSNDTDNKTVFMIFCIQVNAFSPCLNCVDDRVRKDECRKWRKTWGEREKS